MFFVSNFCANFNFHLNRISKFNFFVKLSRNIWVFQDHHERFFKWYILIFFTSMHLKSLLKKSWQNTAMLVIAIAVSFLNSHSCE